LSEKERRRFSGFEEVFMKYVSQSIYTTLNNDIEEDDRGGDKEKGEIFH